MSDFLTNLAARIDGSPEFVRPRTPSLFEPSNLGGNVAVETVGFESRQVSTESDSEMRDDIEGTPIEPIPRRRESTVLENLNRKLVNPIPEPNGATRNTVVPAPLIQKDDYEAKVQVESESKIRSNHEEEPHLLLANPDYQGSSKLEGLVFTKRADQREPPTANQPGTVERAPPNRMSFRFAKESESSDDAPNENRSASIGSPQLLMSSQRIPREFTPPIVRHHSSPWRPAPQDRFETAEPTIQISIGRVEVRATASDTAAPRKERAASSIMSLDHYLRQRSKGSGR
jgi:hypothetical protein